MNATDLINLIGKQITILDSRTGVRYPATIADAKASYGKLRIKVAEGHAPYFEPTKNELDSIK